MKMASTVGHSVCIEEYLFEDFFLWDGGGGCQLRYTWSFVRKAWKYQIRSRKSRTNRQHNGQEKKDKKTNNDLQNTAQKTKDRVTRTPLNTGCELRRSGWGSSIYSTSVSCCIRKMYVCPNRIICSLIILQSSYVS